MDFARILVFVIVFGALSMFGNVYLSPADFQDLNNTGAGTFTNTTGGIQASSIQALVSVQQGDTSTGNFFGDIFFWYGKILAFITFVLESIINIPNIFDTMGIPETALATIGTGAAAFTITPLGIVKSVVGVGFSVMMLLYVVYLISGRK